MCSVVATIPDMYEGVAYKARAIIENHTLFKKPLLIPVELHQLIEEASLWSQEGYRQLEITAGMDEYVCEQ